MLADTLKQLNKLGKVYFDLEFEDKSFYKGVRFVQYFKPIYVNEYFNNQVLYGYDKTFECYDKDDNKVNIEFNQSFKLVTAIHEDGSNMTDYWLERVDKLLNNQRILSQQRDILESFVTEYITLS